MTTGKQKLEPQQFHIIKLVGRDRCANGWATVSTLLFPILSEAMPSELVVFEETETGGRARLTEEGECVLRAMNWL